jgi:hypothetical protein
MRNRYACPLTGRYVQQLMLVPVSETWLGDMHSTRLHELKTRASYGGYSKRILQLRAFLALEIMVTRGLVDAPLASIAKVSRLRWQRSHAGITQLLCKLREERDELTADTAEHLLQGVANMDPRTLMNERRQRLIKKYEHAEEAAILLRRSLLNTDVWQRLGILGENLAEAVEHINFEVRMNIVDELLEQNGETVRRAWEIRE